MPVSCAAAAGVNLASSGGHARRRAAVGGHDAGDGQRERRLGAGPDGQPLVGVEPGEVQPRARVDELRHVAVGEPVGVGEAALVLRRARARSRGSRRRTRGCTSRCRSRAPAAGRGRTPGGWPRGRARDRTAPSAPAGRRARRSSRPAGRRTFPVPAPLSTASLPAGLAHLAGEPRDRVVPADLGERAVGAAQHRRPDAARVVEPLERRLAARAELALVDRVLGIALQLDRATLAGPDVHAAARGALGAGARVEGGHARDLVLGLHQIGHQLLHPAGGAARERERAATRGAEDGEELPAIYPRLVTGVRHRDSSPLISSGTPSSRG